MSSCYLLILVRRLLGKGPFRRYRLSHKFVISENRPCSFEHSGCYPTKFSPTFSCELCNFSPMEWKKLGFSEQILAPKRKVVSGFGLGLGASLILLTIVLFNTSFNVPIFRGFSNFSSTSASSSSSSSTATPTGAAFDFKQGNEGGRVVDSSTHEASLSGMVKNEDPLGWNGESIILEKTHLGKTSGILENGSFTADGGRVPETTHADASGAAMEASLSNSNQKVMASDEALLGNSLGEDRAVIGNSSDSNIVVNRDNNVGNLLYGGEYNKPPTEEESGAAAGNNIITAPQSQVKKMPSSFYGSCDIFDGRWVRDDSKPYYPPGSCPYIDRDFDCQLNGRPDDGYLKWRWQPNGCDIPR